MTEILTAGHLGVAVRCPPGHQESAGTQRSERTTRPTRGPPNAHVQAAGIVAIPRHVARVALLARARPIGKGKAIIATARTVVVAIRPMRTNECDYADPGTDWWTSAAPLRSRPPGSSRLEARGHHVTLEHRT